MSQKPKSRLQLRRRAYMMALYKLRDRNRRDFDTLLEDYFTKLLEMEEQKQTNLKKQTNLTDIGV